MKNLTCQSICDATLMIYEGVGLSRMTQTVAHDTYERGTHIRDHESFDGAFGREKVLTKLREVLATEGRHAWSPVRLSGKLAVISLQQIVLLVKQQFYVRLTG
jgi:hypothetical protein